MLLFLLAACDGMVRYIDIDRADAPPVLAASAAIDTQGGDGNGIFSLCFTESRSIGSYRNWRYDEENIVRKGKITLAENDSIIFTEARDDFDLSLRTSGSGFAIQKKNMTFKAGYAYTLTLEIAGYPTATATVVMPQPPVADGLLPGRIVTRKHPYLIKQLENVVTVVNETMTFYAFMLHLTDNSGERDWYLIRTKLAAASSGSTGTGNIATSDRAIIQDNPDIEVSHLFMNGEADVFIFDRLLISDMSFPNATGSMELLVNANETGNNGIYISHLSPDAYKYYRSLAFQHGGIGFFTEPVSIASNFLEAKGCFAAMNTVYAPFVSSAPIDLITK